MQILQKGNKTNFPIGGMEGGKEQFHINIKSVKKNFQNNFQLSKSIIFFIFFLSLDFFWGGNWKTSGQHISGGGILSKERWGLGTWNLAQLLQS